MSEYAHQPVTDRLPDIDQALFGQEIYEESAVRKIETQPEEPIVGAHVELGARAIALRNIMHTLNQLNKTRGLLISRGYSDFDDRYGESAGELQEDMVAKAMRMWHENTKDYEVLCDVAGLKAAGFSDREISDATREFRNSLINEYGPGKAYASDRERVVKKAERVAKLVSTIKLL